MDNVVVNIKDVTKEGNSFEPKFNPFPGLRPFSIQESHLFFGREGQSEEVLYNLSKNRFVAVIGSSGSGKSSLMYCGVVPILHGGFIAEAGSNWNIINTKPGDGPINNIAEALINYENRNKEVEPDRFESQYRKALIASVIRSSSVGLVEAIKHIDRPKNENILLLVDQFEELFRFKRVRDNDNSFNESLIFVKNLLEAINQEEVPIYVVLTMRSDFIGECSQFPELTELINDSHYLIPQMKRENYIEAITGPIAVGGGKISQRLLHQLLNDVGDNPDQLPILQHALMRTWDYWTLHRLGNDPLDIEHYDAIGRMEKALSEHANEAYDELNPRGKEICEQLFKALTEKGLDNRGIRRPSHISEVCQIAEASESEIVEVVEKFMASGRSFITVSSRKIINKDSIIDISHESLMRIWGRLKAWVEEEAVAVQTYIRLSDAAALYQDGKTGLWRPPDLQLALNWRKKQDPNLAWAKRYAPAFERTMAYLDTSEKEYLAEEENKIRLQKKQLRRSRVFAIILGVAAIISLGFMLYSFILQNEARKQEQEATRQKAMAEEQKNRAEKESDEAERQKKIALESEKEALKQKEIAEKQKEIAEVQKARAIKSAREAILQKEIADQKSAEAKKQKELADVNAQAAIDQKQRAENASERAETLRMLSIAQSMAVKSLQVNKDEQLKSLVAYQAYLFNKNHNGEQHHNDIYNGLYTSLKMLKEEEFNSLNDHSDAVKYIVAHPQNQSKFYSCSSDGKIIEWTKEHGSFKTSLLGDFNTINRVLAISKDGKWLACGTINSLIYLFNLNDETKEPFYLNEHEGAILSLCFSNDSKKLYSSGSDTLIYEWDINKQESNLFLKPEERLRSMNISPEGDLIAGASDKGKLFLWETKNGKQPYILYDMADNSLFSVSFSNSGNMLAASDLEGYVMIWDTKTRDFISILSGHDARVSQVIFSSDGKYIASASFDQTIRIWETSKLNQQPVVIKNNDSWVWSIAFSNDNKYLFAGYNNGRVVWNYTDAGQMANQVCTLIERNMTAEEWSNYVAEDIPYQKTCEGIDEN